MNRTASNGLMLITALIWGTTFVAQQLGMKDVGPFTFTAARFLIGALFVVPLAWREYTRVTALGVRVHGRDVLSWVGLGTLLFLGAILQQIGLMSTSVSNASFLTALYVPMVPLLAWFVDRRRPHLSVWPATIGSVVGTFFLSGGSISQISTGDWWVLASTIFWAGHVLWVGRLAEKKGLPILVALTQFVACGLLALLLAVASEPVTVQGLQSALPAILYGGVLSVGVAFTLQVVAQRHTRPADAAVLLSSEILFAAIAAVVYLGETISTTQIVGGLIIFSSVLAVQLLPMLGRVGTPGAPRA